MFISACVCAGSESVVIRNLEHSLKESPGRSPDTSRLQNGALHGDHSTRKRTRVAVLISGTGVCSLINWVLYLNGTSKMTPMFDVRQEQIYKL